MRTVVYSFRVLLVAVVLVSFTGRNIRAQLTTASISGLLKDESGAVLPGATVSARNLETGQTRSVITDSGGRYRATALPVGQYELKAELSGFSTAVRNMTLVVGQEAVIDFSMVVGPVTQQVQVLGEAPLVDTVTGSISALVDDKKIRDLPLNGRSFDALTLLQSGVKSFTSRGGQSTSSQSVLMSINGAPLRSNTYLLDGAVMLSTNQGGVGNAANVALGIEAIREFNIVTNSYNAEYGRTMGGIVNLVTRGGTNRLHGSVFEFLRNDNLDARNFFDPGSPPEFKRNQFGFTLGGPIKKDKTFFFVAYEGLRERLGLTRSLIVPSAAARFDGVLVPTIAEQVKPYLNLFPVPNGPTLGGGAAVFNFSFPQRTRTDFFQIRGDHHFSEQHSIFGRYTFDDTNVFSVFSFPAFTNIMSSRDQFVTLEHDGILSPALLNIFRLSHSRRRFLVNSEFSKEFGFLPGEDMGLISIGGLSNIGPSSTAPIGELPRQVWTFTDDLSYSSGRHSMKFGWLLDVYSLHLLNSAQRRGSLVFPDLPTFLEGKPSSIRIGTPGSAYERDWQSKVIGLYVQDSLSATPRLTFNLGLRYEFMTSIAEASGFSSGIRDVTKDEVFTKGPLFENPSLRNFAPRIGFAWDLFGKGRTALRGGFGVVYDTFSYFGGLQIATNALPPFSSQTLVNNPDFPKVNLQNARPGRNARGVFDFQLEQEHMLHYNLNLQHQFPGGIGLTMGYVGSRGLNLIAVNEGNPIFPDVVDGRYFYPVGRARRNPAWEGFDAIIADRNSWYNSLQINANRRFSGGFQLQSAYTFSRLVDETQGQLGGDNRAVSGDAGTQPLDRSVDRGLASFHTKHNWQFNTTYDLPLQSQNRTLNRFAQGWQINAIVSVSSGTPFSPSLQTNRSRSGVLSGQANIDRPDLRPGRNNDNIILGGPARYFDPTAFALQSPGFLGNAGRNFLIGPGLATLDFAVTKNTRAAFWGEEGNIQFRAEFFNILNHANFAIPTRTVFPGRAATEQPLASAGRIASTVTSSRQVQFGLKIAF